MSLLQVARSTQEAPSPTFSEGADDALLKHSGHVEHESLTFRSERRCGSRAERHGTQSNEAHDDCCMHDEHAAFSTRESSSTVRVDSGVEMLHAQREHDTWTTGRCPRTAPYYATAVGALDAWYLCAWEVCTQNGRRSSIIDWILSFDGGDYSRRVITDSLRDNGNGERKTNNGVQRDCYPSCFSMR